MSTLDAPAVFTAQAVPGLPSPVVARTPKGVSTMTRPVPPSLPIPLSAPPAFAGLLGGAALVALMTLAWPEAAQAQDAAPKAAAKQASVSKDAKAAGKAPAAQAAKPANGNSKRAAKKAPEPEPEIEIAAADEQQLAAAREVLIGESGCEFNQKIEVNPSSQHPGYVDMSFNKKKYTMKPVLSPTGALRLEDVRSEALMIQIASKTMVMNQKTGQRLVDNCVHPEQRTVSADSGAPSLIK
jgi:Flp pilus assembly protein TadG